MNISLILKTLLIIFLYGCSKPPESKPPEQMCVEAQLKLYDQAEIGSKQRKYFDSAFKSRDAYNAWAWRECIKK